MERLNILIVGGHPADVFDSAGGTLYRHVQRGDHVTALVLTHGARVHDVVISEEMRKQERIPDAETLARLFQERMRVKHREVIEACALFGIGDVRFLNYEDSVLMLREDLIQEIARVIRETKPHIVITHYPFDNAGIADHHAVTGQLVLNGVSAAGSVWPGDPNPPHRVAQIFFMAIPTGMFRGSCLAGGVPCFPDVYVDISDFAEMKVRALDKMATQQYSGAYARKAVEAAEGQAGFFVRVAYAEPFIRYGPEVVEYLPVSEARLARARESESEMHARMDRLVAHRVPPQEG
jgi:LmbE family N-acetylglucosaminyl deacetylase